MSEKVWYASYGSNLLRERFMAYIRGGRVPGSDLVQIGCTDPSTPSQDRGLMIFHPLYFAGTDPRWQNGGVAFLGGERDEGAKTLGRMYLISREQFLEVVLQENGHRSYLIDIGIDLDEAVQKGRSQSRSGVYDTLLFLGEEQGYPIFTFTASWSLEQAPIHPPALAYLRVIAEGLREAFRLSNEGVLDYLLEVPGVAGNFSRGKLAEGLGAGRTEDGQPRWT